MANPLVLYSTNTWLAVRIARMYYNDVHYVWCNRYFDSLTLPPHSGALPPTSSPSDIYDSLYAEVKAGDRHSAKIDANRLGMLKGAAAKKKAGIITDAQERDINDIVKAAETKDFRPLLFVIPYSLVAKMVRLVPVSDRAHPLWEEYIIEALPATKFDALELRKA